METNWAAEHLQVIRTLMERSALYRRALAPIMLLSGAIGLAGVAATRFMPPTSTRGFALFWLAISVVALSTALLLVRRQALNEAEPFWSLPTQRVAAGLFPCFFTGLAAGAAAAIHPGLMPAWLLAALWSLNYGCALRAAGSFLQRGIKLFGSLFLAGGAAVLIGGSFCPWLQEPGSGHYLMGGFFGLLQFAYGVYLYFTERKPKS